MGSEAACGACAKELGTLRATLDFMELALAEQARAAEEARGRLERQEQALGRALASLVPAVEALSAKVQRLQGRVPAAAAACEPLATRAVAYVTGAAPAPSAPPPPPSPPSPPPPPPALHAAAAAGDAFAVRRHLAAGDSPWARDARGDTALHHAARLGHVATVEALLGPAAGDLASARGHWLRTPLHLVAEAGHADAACSLLGAGAQREAVDARGATPLHLAAAAGQRAVAALLLAEGAAVDALDGEGRSPLLRAAARGHAPLAQLLVDNGADPLLRDAARRSALRAAAAAGHRAALAVLVDKVLEDGRLDVEEADGAGRSLLHEAAAGGHLEVMRLLLHYGAAINAADGDGRSALVHAARGGHADALDLLLERGADAAAPEAKVYKEYRGGAYVSYMVPKAVARLPLVAAAEGGSARVVRALAAREQTRLTEPVLLHSLEAASCAEVLWELADAAPTAFLKAAPAALSTVARSGNAATLQALLDAGVDVRSESCTFALKCAVEGNQPECVAALLMAGVCDSETYSALDKAAELGYEKCVAAFVEKGLSEKEKNQALGVAKYAKKIEVIRVLLRAGADPFSVELDEAYNFVKYVAKQKVSVDGTANTTVFQ